MKKMLILLWFLILSNSICFGVNNQEVITLKDGTTLKGEILEQSDDYILIRTSFGEVKVDKENIKSPFVTIYLNDSNIIKGKLLSKSDKDLVVESSLGIFEIELYKIEKIVENDDQKINIEPVYNNSKDIATIGNALLYQQRQKKVSTALGFQTLGAGLLYSEKYTLGTIMLLAENGLLVSSALVNDPEITPYLWGSGLLLKAVNTFLTIKSVNDYNNNLIKDISITNEGNQQEIKFTTKKYDHSLAIDLNLGLFIDYSKDGNIGDDQYSESINKNNFSGINLDYSFSKKGINISHHFKFNIDTYSIKYIDFNFPSDVQKINSSLSSIMYGVSYSFQKNFKNNIILSLYSGVDAKSLAYIPIQLGVINRSKLSDKFDFKVGFDLSHFIVIDPRDTTDTLINTTASINLGLILKF